MHLSLITLVLSLATAVVSPALADPQPIGSAALAQQNQKGFEKRLLKEVDLPHERSLEDRDLLEERAIPNKKRDSTNTYSALVAIGASYTDNAHARASQYAGSLRNYYPYSKYGGRYTNGKVAVEYMAEAGLKKASSGLKMINYAYGGSVIKNQLSGTSASWPAAADQISTFLSDLKAGKVSTGAQRVLFYTNSGINPVMQLWNNALSAGLTSSSIAKAKEGITANTQAYAAAIRSINTDSTVKSKANGLDFMLVGIPPLEVVPTTANQIPSSYSSTKRQEALDLMKTLTTQFNTEIKTFAAALKTENKNGKVMYYDLSALWYSMISTPKSYGITAGTKATCYNSTTGGICSDPTHYIYFDTLHPVTSIHKLMAEKMVLLVSRS